MTTTTQQPYDLRTLFIFDSYEGESQKTFLAEVGILVFQSALMRYMVEHTSAESDMFEKFVQTHANSKTFMDELYADYPEFEELLTAEMRSFCNDVVAN